MAKVLVIDDDEVIRALLRECLSDAGHRVAEAVDGLWGMANYRENQADVVIVDLIMPGQDGLGTIREMRREFGDVKIIAISGGGHHIPADFLDVATKIGARYAFPKPLDLQSLLDAVDELSQP